MSRPPQLTPEARARLDAAAVRRLAARHPGMRWRVADEPERVTERVTHLPYLAEPRSGRFGSRPPFTR
jgi:hypothetical protein